MRLLTPSGPSLAEHLRQHGEVPAVDGRRLLDEIDRSGLLGRGGAGFPAGRKLRTVAAGSSPVVLGNGCEGEPASGKDAFLLARAPHLVLDGLQVAARAVGATRAHLAVRRGSSALPLLRKVISERTCDPAGLTLHEIEARYVASEESALVSAVNGGEAKPTFTPPRPFEQGVDKRPTLVSNVETLAHMALIARHGASWFREVGDREEPGTQLVTVRSGGASAVVEVATGTLVGDLLARGDGTQAVLVGGYFGTWLPAGLARALPLTHRDLRAAGGALGAGIVVALPTGACGLLETAHVAAYLAAESARQCGPCFNGLPAIAGAVRRLALGPWDDASRRDLDRWLGVVAGRGACRHPDGAVRFVLSALSVFADDLGAHRAGRPCAGVQRRPVLPVGGPA